MKKIFWLFCLIPHGLSAQITFNVQSNFGYRNLKLTNILPTDSCYYLNGVITDSAGQQNIFGSLFLKISLTGDTLTTKKLVSASKQYLTWNTGLFADDEGDLVTAGETPKGIFLMKYTQTGDSLFIREYDNPYFPLDSFITSDDFSQYESGYYLSGIFLQPPEIYKPDMVLFKLDQSGEILYQKTYGSNLSDFISSTVVEPNGELIIGAGRNNQNTNLQNFTSRTYIFKVDSLGNILWEYLSPQGQLCDLAYSMVKTPDGGLVVASGKGIEHEVNASVGALRWHSYIFKLNANHQQIWGRELRGVRHTGGTGVAKLVTATDRAGFVACGNLLEDKSFGEPKYGSWVFKVSNQGDSLWARYYTFVEGVEKYYEPVDMKVTPDGGYIIAGQLTDGLEAIGWLMKLDSFGCLIPGCNANDGPNATEEAKAEMKLAIYPNPTSDFLNFELRSPRPPQRASFRIVDATGKVMKEVQSESPRDTFIVPVREWAGGVYFLQYLEDNEIRAVERFVVSHP